MKITIQISPGELYDRLSILGIKAGYLSLLSTEATNSARQTVHKELTELMEYEYQLEKDMDYHTRETLRKIKEQLWAMNRALWDTEEKLRECEQNADFSENFIAYARGVYKTNDKRARLKREINELFVSELFEVKLFSRKEMR